MTICLTLVSIFLYGCGVQDAYPRAQQGLLDLSHWDFEKDGIAPLDGHWEFYWDRLLTPDDFSENISTESRTFFPVPGLWGGFNLKTDRLPGDGVTTYRLNLRTTPARETLAIRVGLIQTAYKIWINGKYIASGGVVGKTSQSSKPQAAIGIFNFKNPGDHLEIIIQVSNFFQSRGGMRGRLYLGTEEQIRKKHNAWVAYDSILFGCLIFMAIYLGVLYTFRTEDRSPLYYGIVCLSMAVSSMIHGLSEDAYLSFGFFNPPYEVLTKIAYYCVTLGLPPLMLFLHALFPEEWNKKILRFFLWALLALHALLLFVPIRVFCEYIIVLEVFSIIGAIYMGYVCAKAVAHKNMGALFLSFGIGLSLMTGFYDFLIDIDIVHGPQLSNIGIFICALLNSLFISWRFSKAFSAVRSLSEELTAANIELSRLDRVKDEFLANTSHELRTPLNGIMGIAESLIHGAGGKLPEKAVANLSMIFSSTRRLAGLVSDILDFSKLKSRDIQLAQKPVDINALSYLVLSVSRGLVGDKSLELIKDIPGDIPCVRGDENRLQQILYNLIGNAIKFTDQGEIRVAAIQMDSMVQVSVSDTGIGIPADKFETIFQVFEQGDSTSSREYGGTGLGLSITRHLVELHGGELRVESQVGEGSVFYFTLPVSDVPPEKENFAAVSTVMNDTATTRNFLLPVTAESQATTLDSPPLNSEPCQVLIVDDDPVNLQVVANHLLLEKITFQTAPDGTTALERIESGQMPHVLLLDIMMPKITGYEVCRKLRERFSPSELPIIMLTAKTHLADLVEAYKAGASDYLSKPFSRDELISRVRCHLELRASYANFVEKQRLEREVSEQKQKKELARLQAEKEKLEKLRYQLNPHFLFNALASIRGAVLKDRKVARELISHLATFSRLTLSRGSMDTTTIAEELEVIRHYLAMEQIRFGDYLSLRFEIGPDTEKLEVPALVLQPLVENAVKYGSRTSPDALEVAISAKPQPPDMIRLEISNSGRWVEPGTIDSRYSTGTGIENVRQRLEKYYASRYRFETNTDGGQVTIAIDIPRVIMNEH